MIVHGEGLRAFIEHKLECTLDPKCQFIGRVRDGKLIGVLGFQHWTREDVEVLWAGERGFGSKALANVAWHYIWETLGCTRCTGYIRADNTHSLRLAERMGFVREGVKRRARNGVDVIVVGMLREECRWYEQGQ